MRTGRFTLLVAICAMAMLTGCSSMNVFTDYGEGVDFSEFETFHYRDSDTNLSGSSPLAHQRIVAALEREMAASGLKQVDSDPDLFVSYYASSTQQVQFRTTYTGVNSWGRRGRGWGTSMSGSTTTASTFEQGTLVVDVWDARNNQLVWRGEITDTLSSNPDRNTDLINNGIAKAFEDFPPSM